MKKSLKINFILSLLKTLIVSATPLIIFPYAARILGTEGIGRVQYIQAIAGVFQVFASFGISTYGIREGSKIRDNKKCLGKFTTELLIINFITTGIALAIYSVTFFIEDFQNYKNLLLIFALYIIFYGINLDWFFNAIEEFEYITKRTALFYALSILIMLIFLQSPENENVYAYVLIIPYMGVFISNFFQIKKQVPIFGSAHYALKKHIKTMFWFFAITLSINIYVLLDTAMLGFISADRSVGLYSAASKLSRAIVQLIAAIGTVFIPRLSYYIGTNQKGEYQKLLSKTIQLVMVLIIPASVGLYCLSEQAIVIYSGKKFIDAVPSMKLFAVFLPFSALNNFLGSQILLPNNQEKLFFKATVAGALSDVILNFCLIPNYDFVGATIATFIAEIIVFIICMWGSRQYINLKKLGRLFGKCMLASFPILCITFLIKSLSYSTIITTVVSMFFSIIVYCVIILKLRIDIVDMCKNILAKKMYYVIRGMRKQN